MDRYDRQRLLLGPMRNQVLELSEVERYGADSFGDPDYISIFGMRPAEWFAKGLRLLGRTAVECTRDALADAIGTDIANVALNSPSRGWPLVVDPFVGSGNTLHWIVRHLPGARGVGFELDPAVFAVSRRNLEILGLPIEITKTEHRTGLARLTIEANRLLVVFVAPPWGEALSETTGLDLGRTDPPVREVIDLLANRFAANPLLCAVQVFESTNQPSIDALAPRFAWSAARL